MLASRMCVDRHQWRVLPPHAPPFFLFRSSGFSPPHCYQASQAPNHQYYPWICHPLSPPRSGATSSVQFSSAFGRPWRQDRRASLGKAYDLPTYRPATHRFDMPDIGPRLFASARPSPRCHLAGSLFATYAVLPHASSPRSVSTHAVALLVSPFRPVTVGSFTSGGYTPEDRS